MTALILVVLVDGPLAEDDNGTNSLEAGAWLLVGCIAASMCLAWMWSGRCALLDRKRSCTVLPCLFQCDSPVPAFCCEAAR